MKSLWPAHASRVIDPLVWETWDAGIWWTNTWPEFFIRQRGARFELSVGIRSDVRHRTYSGGTSEGGCLRRGIRSLEEAQRLAQRVADALSDGARDA